MNCLYEKKNDPPARLIKSLEEVIDLKNEMRRQIKAPYLSTILWTHGAY